MKHLLLEFSPQNQWIILKFHFQSKSKDGPKLRMDGGEKCLCVLALNRNSLQQSHFRQKEEEDEFRNEINNGDLKHLLSKKKKKKKSCSQNATLTVLRN